MILGRLAALGLRDPPIPRGDKDGRCNQSYPKRRRWRGEASHQCDGKKIKADDFKKRRIRGLDGMNRQVATHDQQGAKDYEPKRGAPIWMPHKLPDEPGTYSLCERLPEFNDPGRSVAQPQHNEYPCRYRSEERRVGKECRSG